MSNCDAKFATALEFARFWCQPDPTPEQDATITAFLEIAASDVHASLAAADACDCTLSSWGAAFLKKLNIIDAAVWHNCPCGRPNLSDAQKNAFLKWINEQLALIRDGKLELCAGETGAGYPALDVAETNYNDWSAAVITNNRYLRNP